MSLQFPLPTSPEGYEPLLADIRQSASRQLAGIKMRALAEEDFYFFIRYIASFGSYLCGDGAHPLYGHPWAEHPFVFRKARQLQREVETGVSSVFYNWHRYAFKTELITKLLTMWELLRDPKLTFCLMTYKVDETGQAIYESIRQEFEGNPEIHRLWPDIVPAKGLPKSTNTSFTLARPLGPKEPSVSIHPLGHMPTSQHYPRVIVDDGVVQETVTSPDNIRKTRDMIRLTTTLHSDATIDRHIGTVWDAYDPNMQLLAEGFFSTRDHVQPYLADGSPTLRSDPFLKKWRKQMGEYHWSSQMLGDPQAKGQQNFMLMWLDQRYRTPPQEEAVGKNVYIIADMATGKEHGDFHAIWVIGLGEDRKRYALDLVRERTTYSETVKLLFDLVRKWRPIKVYMEEVGGMTWVQSIRHEQEVTKFRFQVGATPKTPGESKESRIQKLQPVMERQDWMFPAVGFGHASADDTRDTLEQFVNDEYRLWTPVRGSVLHDDCLDALSWVEHPRMHLRYPESVFEEVEHPSWSKHGSRRQQWDGVSWEAW